jgi:heterodisulfide reductase subunit C
MEMNNMAEEGEQPQPTSPAPAPAPEAPAPAPAPAEAPAPAAEAPAASAMQGEVVTPDPEFTAMLIEKGAKTLNLCFQCGTCTGSCASGRFTAFRTRKIVRKAQLGLKDQILDSPDLWMCTTCYTCLERCPRGVEIPDIIFLLRNLAVKEGHMAEAHKKVAGFLIKSGHMVPLSDEYQAKREHMGLKPKPDTVMTNEQAKTAFNKLIQICAFDKLIGGGGD